jgi:hypothetical protein
MNIPSKHSSHEWWAIHRFLPLNSLAVHNFLNIVLTFSDMGSTFADRNESCFFSIYFFSNIAWVDQFHWNNSIQCDGRNVRGILYGSSFWHSQFLGHHCRSRFRMSDSQWLFFGRTILTIHSHWLWKAFWRDLIVLSLRSLIVNSQIRFSELTCLTISDYPRQKRVTILTIFDSQIVR